MRIVHLSFFRILKGMNDYVIIYFISDDHFTRYIAI